MIGGFAARAKNLTLRLLRQFLPALLLLALPAVQSAEPRVRIVTLGDSIMKGIRPGNQRYRVRLSITTRLKYRYVPRV